MRAGHWEAITKAIDAAAKPGLGHTGTDGVVAVPRRVDRHLCREIWFKQNKTDFTSITANLLDWNLLQNCKFSFEILRVTENRCSLDAIGVQLTFRSPFELCTDPPPPPERFGGHS